MSEQCVNCIFNETDCSTEDYFDAVDGECTSCEPEKDPYEEND